MNANGKRARRYTGLSRHRVHFLQHTRKSDATRRRKHWIRAGVLKRTPGGKLVSNP